MIKNKWRSGRKPSHTFVMLQHRIIDSANFHALSGKAVKLLLDIARQYNGNNNGDLQAAWTLMSKCGWRSKETLHNAIKELLHFGMIEKTRQGSLNQCSLYALSWCAIDECKGKLEIAPTRLPSNLWMIPKGVFAATALKKSQHDMESNKSDKRI